MRDDFDVLEPAVVSMKRSELRRTIYSHGDFMPEHYITCLVVVLDVRSQIVKMKTGLDDDLVQES